MPTHKPSPVLFEQAALTLWFLLCTVSTTGDWQAKTPSHKRATREKRRWMNQVLLRLGFGQSPLYRLHPPRRGCATGALAGDFWCRRRELSARRPAHFHPWKQTQPRANSVDRKRWESLPSELSWTHWQASAPSVWWCLVPAVSLLLQKPEEAISSWLSPRGCRFRSIDPSDVQSLRLISVVPGARWRRRRSELRCLFSQITALRGSPLLPHNEVCPPTPKERWKLVLRKKKKKVWRRAHSDMLLPWQLHTRKSQWSNPTQTGRTREGIAREGGGGAIRRKTDDGQTGRSFRMEAESCLLFLGSSWESAEPDSFVYEWRWTETVSTGNSNLDRI